ncbi:MAG: T9SS type A sorting domain-containing protein [Bacteroidetes bacterium]|nr:T9SS type A sorting domain-containing protein [Bacteroidota bacterium]
MIRKITLSLMALLAFYATSFAQKCGTDVAHQKLMTSDPNYAAAYNDFNARWANYAGTHPIPKGLKTTLSNGIDTVYEIPVVVHVVHTGGAIGTIYNPSTAAIQAWIDYTNQAWAASGYGTYPVAGSGGTRIPIKFVLAQRDSLCNSTTGIDRVNGTVLTNYNAGGVNSSSTLGENDDVVKDLSRWPPQMYYNIWIVNKIDGNDGTSGTFTAGFAYFPGANWRKDGTIVLATQVGAGFITLPHELGHAFNLEHVFAGGTSSTCPPTGPCATTGDFVCDTEPIMQSAFTCPSGTNPCTGTSYNNTPHNFMDYSNCQDRFTPGQMQRVLYALKSQNTRACYITSLGATPPPTTSLPTPCTINNVDFNTNGGGLDIGPKDVIIADPSSMPAAQRDTFMWIHSFGYNNDAVPPATTAGYVDATCKHRVTLVAGRTYSLTVVVGGSTGASKAKVFIDYNNNGVWETNENIMRANYTATVKQNNFTVPNNASTVFCQPIRMRVIADFAGSVDSCGQLDYGQAEDYTVIIKGAGGTSTASVTINNPPIGGNPSCFGTQLTFYATKSSSTVVSGWKWLVNNNVITGATTDTFRTSSLLDLDKVKVRMFYTTPCGIDSTESNIDTIRRAATVAPKVKIALTAGTIPGCIDDTLTFSVSSTTNPGTAPTYQWQTMVPPAVVFSNVAGATASSYKSVNAPANTKVRVFMTSNSGCAVPTTAVSDTQTMTYTTKAPTVTIAVTTGTNPGCAGQPLTFTATPTVGGTAPTYQWKINGVNQTGSGATFTTTLVNNDVVSCVMTSNSPCRTVNTATSNNITFTETKITADISVTETTTPPICNGHVIDFKATPVNGGNTPPATFQWYVNNTAITGATGTTFSHTILNGDLVKCILHATDPCVLNAYDTSNVLTEFTTPSDTPTIFVKITQGYNPGCLDSLIEFTANLANLGLTPDYKWYVNGSVAGLGNVFSSVSLLDGDIVQVIANKNALDGGCYLPDTIAAKPDTMVRSLTLDPPIIHLIGGLLIVDRPGTFIWYGPTGKLSGGTNGQLTPTQIGPYYAVTNNRGCLSRPSNTLTITLLDINTVDMSNEVKVYPNPTSGELTLDWKGKLVNIDIDVYSSVGQHLMSEQVRNASSKSINLSNLADGNYYVILKEGQDKQGVIKIAVHK